MIRAVCAGAGHTGHVAATPAAAPPTSMSRRLMPVLRILSSQDNDRAMIAFPRHAAGFDGGLSIDCVGCILPVSFGSDRAMSRLLTRRNIVTAGIVGAAGVGAGALGARYGVLAPDGRSIEGLGESFTYS